MCRPSVSRRISQAWMIQAQPWYETQMRQFVVETLEGHRDGGKKLWVQTSPR